jgi:hypothetical protein
MANDVTAPCPPPGFERELAAFSSRLPDLDASSFATAQLARFEARSRALEDALRPAPRSRILALLAPLDAMIARRIDDSSEARALAQVEFEVLADLPAFALEGTVRAFVKGEKGDGHFRPMPGELRQEALRRCEPLRLERHRLEKVIEASRRPAKEKLSAERRSELAQMLRRAVPQAIRDLQAELGASAKPPSATPAAAMRASAAE